MTRFGFRAFIAFCAIPAMATCSSVYATWRTANLDILPNQYVQLQVTSATGSNQARSVTMTIGGVTSTWSVTTAVVTCGGTSHGGYCWYMGAAGQSCDTVCSARGGCNLTGTRNYIGSDGTYEQCGAVLSALGVLHPSTFYNAGSGNAGNQPVGCINGTNTRSYWLYAPPTTTCAGSHTSALRACACNS